MPLSDAAIRSLKPNTSKPAKGHKSYPYLLGGLRIDRPNQVRCADITYLPMRKGFLYLAAILDWFIRKILTWRISNHWRVVPRSTTTTGHALPMADNRPPWTTSTQPKPIRRCRQ